MRSGLARRCASYCTWSSKSRTTVLESADDQWRIPVTRGNFDNSCGVAGALSGSLASEAASVLALAAAVGTVGTGAVGCWFAALVLDGLTGIFSVRGVALKKNVVFSSQTPPANAAQIAMNASSISRTGRRLAGSGCSRLSSGAEATSATTAFSSLACFSAGRSGIVPFGIAVAAVEVICAAVLFGIAAAGAELNGGTTG